MTMNRSKLGPGLVGLVGAVAALTLAGERPAAACGGCFHPPTQTVTDITDERMLLAVSGTQSTLYDQIQYSGSPSNFAWVLPIHGVVTVGLSADVLFDVVDALTATQIRQPAANCPQPAGCSSGDGDAGALAVGPVEGKAGGVTILTSANVGPYATVQLKSTDGNALENWLTQNGYNIPAAIQPILDAYIQEGFDFLAMKLLPDQGVQSMRPVRVSTPGASVTLPLRMASIGTGPITGITIWVVADGRYEPQNFPFFHIDDTQLVWDFKASLSNYTTLRVAQEANDHNGSWEIESSININQQIITSTIQSGGQPSYFRGVPSDAGVDYLPLATGDAGTDAGSPEDAREADIAALFVGMSNPSVRVTRVRSDIAQNAMTKDIVFQASSDQSELSNVRYVPNSVNLTCSLYSGCNVVGSGTPAQAAASIADGGGAVMTSTGGASGGGTVVGSSSGNGAAGSSGGNAITPSAAAPSGGGGCSVSPRSAGSGVGFAAIAGVLGLFVRRTVRRRKSKG
jgi:MYXO-CTERM domain-containing protein